MGYPATTYKLERHCKGDILRRQNFPRLNNSRSRSCDNCWIVIVAVFVVVATNRCNLGWWRTIVARLVRMDISPLPKVKVKSGEETDSISLSKGGEEREMRKRWIKGKESEGEETGSFSLSEEGWERERERELKKGNGGRERERGTEGARLSVQSCTVLSLT